MLKAAREQLSQYDWHFKFLNAVKAELHMYREFVPFRLVLWGSRSGVE